MMAESSIDRLPDDVLISIAARLSLKEAQRASVVGHRWRYLWRYSQFLSFDAAHKNNINELEQAIRQARRVMEEHSNDTIQEFRLAGELHSCLMDSLLRFAFRKKVQKLELNLSPVFERYEFPEPIDHLRAFNLFTDCGSLTSLRLNQVDVSGKTLGCLLRCCPLLEELCVEDSDSLHSLETSDFRAGRLRLLRIYSCTSFRKLDVWAPNLGSFTLQWCLRMQSMSFKDDIMPLVELKLSSIIPLKFEARLRHFSASTLSSLETLEIQHPWPVESTLVSYASEYPEFPRLKTLAVDVHFNYEVLSCLVPLIESAPLLTTLTVNMKFATHGIMHSRTIMPALPQRCSRKHYGNLETLHITGFVGIREADVEIAIYVLETYADSINKIVIDFQSLTRKQTESLNVEEMPMARKGFLMLKEKVPPHVQLLLVHT